MDQIKNKDEVPTLQTPVSIWTKIWQQEGTELRTQLETSCAKRVENTVEATAKKEQIA